ncbi:hypothetical protein C4J81_11355 [Deltaproteobacteria bacterium Smac51]|nr:hypothetical protein C4J81_11355 [Deltaproteobacteria bacterium Smac51]
MTTSDAVSEAAVEEKSLKPGIYLEEKISTIGTGSTAKSAEYRTFWVTLTVSEKSAVMVLLNDDFRPTAIRETFSTEVLLGPSWHYIAEGEKRYSILRPHLDKMLAPPATARSSAPAKSASSGNWWDGGAPAKAAAPKKKAEPAKKNNWWDS